MNKVIFLRKTFNQVDIDVKALIEKSKGKRVNGNALNALVKKYTTEAYNTDFWWNGEYSSHMTTKTGEPLKLQVDMPNFRELINRRIIALQ